MFNSTYKMKKLYMLLALVGIFAACQPEELQTTFEVDAAKAVIDVTCIDIQTNQPAAATLTTSAGVVSGSQVILTGNKELPATEVSITAAYQGKTYGPVKVSVNALKAGGNAVYSATIVVGELLPVNPDPAAYDCAPKGVASVTVSDPIYFTRNDGHALVDHAGKKYAKNLTEYAFEFSVVWNAFSGSEVSTFTNVADEDDALVFSKYVAAFNSGKVTTEQLYKGTVSAWAYYTVYQNNTLSAQVYEVTKTLDGQTTSVGEFTVVNYASSVQFEEIANPEGHGHYHYGHGTPHSDDTNAGGGIIAAE